MDRAKLSERLKKKQPPAAPSPTPPPGAACASFGRDDDAPPGPKKAKATKQAAEYRGRLPHGARMVVTYDALRVEWGGTLYTEVGGRPWEFSASASGVKKLLRALDDGYRAAKGKQES